jgi:Ca2+-binding EF-hand superfamily protein
MTRRQKLLIAAAVLAGLGAAAVPTLAAQTGSANGATAQPTLQTAFGGSDDDRGWDGPRHHGHGFGPGGPDFAGPGPMGMGFDGPGGRGPEALLDKFDTNKDGKISKAEIDAVQADQLKKYDKDGDGTLSLAEYQALFADETHEAMVRTFQGFDRDGDGKVTAAELNGRLDHLVQRLDRNNDGVIDQNELAGPRMGPGDRNGPPPPAEQDNGG